jgi:hypothetical protein
MGGITWLVSRISAGMKTVMCVFVLRRTRILDAAIRKKEP